MVGDPGNVVQVQLNQRGVEHRQESFRNIIPVAHQMEFWIRLIKPFRLLSAGHKMHLAHPRRELLHTSEPVLQQSIVPETGLGQMILRIVYLA